MILKTPTRNYSRILHLKDESIVIYYIYHVFIPLRYLFRKVIFTTLRVGHKNVFIFILERYKYDFTRRPFRF